MVEHFDMTTGFNIKCFFHRGALHQYRHITVQYIVCCASATMPRAVQMLDRLITTHPTMTATQTIPTNLILFSKFFMTIILTVIIVTHLCIFYLINECIAPVADIFACCATPSPKFLVLNAVSPSGIIHAARSGTRFRHFNATMLAAIR